jgi:hypothetical protein
MCRTMQRAVIRQAKREGLPVWAWLLASISVCFSKERGRHPLGGGRGRSRKALVGQPR